MTCELCDDDGRIEVNRTEPDGRTTWWAVPCRCPAGQRWEGRLSTRIPPAGPAGTWTGGGGRADSPARPPPGDLAEMAERLQLLRDSLRASLGSPGGGGDEPAPPGSG